MPQLISWPNTSHTKATFSTQLKHEPSMCMVAPKGITISETSRLMPVCSATSILVGIVATDEQVPRDTTAGLVICRSMTPGPRRLRPTGHVGRKAEQH